MPTNAKGASNQKKARALPSASSSDGKPRERSHKESISRSLILKTALRIADEGGLEALTMRTLAAELDVYPTTIQWHTGTKASLLASVSALIFDDLVLSNEHETSWDEWIADLCHAWRKMMHGHPNLASVVNVQLVMEPKILPAVERIIGVLERAGFRDRGLLDAYNTLMGFLVGWITMELSTEPDSQDDDWRDRYARELNELSPVAYPTLTRLMPLLENNIFMARYESGRTRPMDQSFNFAVTTMVAGLISRLPLDGDQEK